MEKGMEEMEGTREEPENLERTAGWGKQER
jgi:hypothetical protein